MAAIKYKVELTEAERSRLNEVSQRGKASVRTVKRALSLLQADQGLRDREIADVLLVNAATVARARKRYVEEGLEAASNDRPRPGQERKEDVLDLYQQAYHPERPVVCFDETSRQLTGAVRPPLEAAPGRVARYDTEYQRNGTRNLFMICEPRGGWRHVEVTERRTAVDFAHQMRWLVDEVYPDAEVVRLVLDNLNTHQLGSLYEAFEPGEARRIAQRLEFHYTPTHGSWLNMAEIELSVFSRGCLNRRISDEAELRREVAALERERNAARLAIDWRFTTKDARRKLQHIYPTRSD